MINKKISVFNSTTDTHSKELVSIGEVLHRINNGTYKKTIEALRGGDAEAKKSLPTFAMHGQFDKYRKKDNFSEASGLIIIDIDDCEDELMDIKDDIIENHPSAFSILTSPSGTGIKVLYEVDPLIVNADTYRDINKKLALEFEQYGSVDFLSVTDCLIASYDPDLYINDNCYPRAIFIKNVDFEQVELESRDESIELWEDAEEFFETVLSEQILESTNNNYHFIQVALFDLKKFGFSHPEHDLSFIIDWAEEHFKVSPQNKTRFNEAVEVSKRYSQTKWPYNLTSNTEDEGFEDDYDYSEYITDSKEVSNDAVLATSESREGIEYDGLIDYTTLFKRVHERVLEGDRVGSEISLSNFADIFRLRGTGILTVTGIPGHGKTEFVDQLIIDLARLHGEKSLIVGFEQTPEEHLIKLSRKVAGADITCDSYLASEKVDSIENIIECVTGSIKHVDVNRVGGNIEKILEKAAILKKTFDYKYLVLDPFNMLSTKTKLNGHEKIEEILRRLTHFSHQMGILVVLVAHPFKMKKDEKTGEFEVPDFYSVKGSSAFFEMSYHGLVVYRSISGVMVRVLKVKQNNLGIAGEQAYFGYDRQSGRYIPVDESGSELDGDHRDRDWLEKWKK